MADKHVHLLQDARIRIPAALLLTMVPLCAFILAHKHTLIFVNMIYMSSDTAPCTQEAN